MGAGEVFNPNHEPAAHAIGATANPAPTKAVLVSRSRRVSAVPSCELDSRGVVLQFIAGFSYASTPM